MKKQATKRTNRVDLQIGDLVSINPFPEHPSREERKAASIGFYGSLEELIAALEALSKP
jgi:hypothetical protein